MLQVKAQHKNRIAWEATRDLETKGCSFSQYPAGFIYFEAVFGVFLVLVAELQIHNFRSSRGDGRQVLHKYSPADELGTNPVCLNKTWNLKTTSGCRGKVSSGCSSVSSGPCEPAGASPLCPVEYIMQTCPVDDSAGDTHDQQTHGHNKLGDHSPLFGERLAAGGTLRRSFCGCGFCDVGNIGVVLTGQAWEFP